MRDIETIDCELRLLPGAWRVARHMGCSPRNVRTDQLLDERAIATEAKIMPTLLC